MKKVALLIASIILISEKAVSQNDSEGSTSAPRDAITSTTSAPSTSTPLVPTDEICKMCVCKDGNVDCSSKEINKFFTKGDWAGLKDFKPIHVDLSNNQIKAITQMVELPIETLNLSRCGIQTIEKASFQYLQSMKTLDLSHNNLTVDRLNPHVFEGRYSPEEFEPLRSMRTLSLAYNDLHSLNDDVFEHLPELTELDLSGNPMKFIDHITLIAIASLPMLKVLKLKSCQLTEIPSKFLHTPRYLEYLDISDNHLTAVPLELEEATSLVYLNMNKNPIVRLEEDSEDNPGFPVLPKLEELHMCDMPKLVEVGEGALGGLQRLKRLHISYNKALKTIHPKALAAVDENGEMYDWPQLKELYLQWNNLSEVDSRLVSRWDHLEVIEVGNNPYLCDCSTQWMVDVLVPTVEALNPNASTHMMCEEPIEMRGKTMQKLRSLKKPMRCVDKYGHRPERDGAILLGTLIGVLLAVPIMLTIVLLWRRGYFATCGLKGQKEQSRAFYKRAQTEDDLY